MNKTELLQLLMEKYLKEHWGGDNEFDQMEDVVKNNYTASSVAIKIPAKVVSMAHAMGSVDELADSFKTKLLEALEIIDRGPGTVPEIQPLPFIGDNFRFLVHRYVREIESDD